MNQKYKCTICKKKLDSHEAYEYRGAYSCAEHFDQMEQRRNIERQAVMDEQDSKTRKFQDLDLSDSVVGKENRKLLKKDIEIASKESLRVHRYEHPEDAEDGVVSSPDSYATNKSTAEK